MAAPTYGTNASASELAVSIYDQMQSTFVETKYPDLLWKTVVPQRQIRTDINPGAQNLVVPVRDMTGKAQFMGNGAVPANIPRSNISLKAFTVPMQWSAAAATVTNEDARVYSHGGLGSLVNDLVKPMKRALELLLETTVFFGESSLGFYGWMSYTGVATTTAASNGGSPASTLWANKTAEQMVKDVNDAIQAVYLATKTVHIPDSLFLAPESFIRLSSTPMTIGATTTGAVYQTALEFLKKNNAYTSITGQELNIQPIRWLSLQAAGGTTHRMVVADTRDDNQGLPFPLAPTVGAPVPEALSSSFYAEQKFGSFYLTRPQAMAYVDGL